MGAAYDGAEVKMVEASWRRWTGGVNGARKMLCRAAATDSLFHGYQTGTWNLHNQSTRGGGKPYFAGGSNGFKNTPTRGVWGEKEATHDTRMPLNQDW
jgi:hypothetical protein